MTYNDFYPQMVIKKCTFLSINVFSKNSKYLGTQFIMSIELEIELSFYVVIQAMRRSRRLQGKGSTFIFQLF